MSNHNFKKQLLHLRQWHVLFCHFWESLSLEIQMYSSLIFFQAFGSWQVGWREKSRKACIQKHFYQHEAVHGREYRPRENHPPTCPQLDFLRHLIQSEAVSFSSILQPINQAGNKTPDSMPSSQLLNSLWPGKSAICNNVYGRGHLQSSTNKPSLLSHLTGRHMNLARPHWHGSHSCFHLKLPFHSVDPRHWAFIGIIPMNPNMTLPDRSHW